MFAFTVLPKEPIISTTLEEDDWVLVKNDVDLSLFRDRVSDLV